MTQTKTPATDYITLRVHICDQRRSYLARFATERQAIDFINRKSAVCVFDEVESAPVGNRHGALIDLLCPLCEHGLSANNCYGPQHYYYDEEEQARGFHNS